MFNTLPKSMYLVVTCHREVLTGLETVTNDQLRSANLVLEIRTSGAYVIKNRFASQHDKLGAFLDNFETFAMVCHHAKHARPSIP